MSDYFELGSSEACAMMAICGQSLFPGIAGPFGAPGSSGVTFPTTSSPGKSNRPETVLPGWDSAQVQDMEEIWMEPEESLSTRKKYVSAVQREDITQIQELAKLFVFRAKSSPRHLPYYRSLSPATTPPATPTPEPADTQHSATPSHEDVKLLITEGDADEDIIAWVNGKSAKTDDLDISSILQEASCEFSNNAEGETPTSLLSSVQEPGEDHSSLAACDEPEAGDGTPTSHKPDGRTGVVALTAETGNKAEHPEPCLPFMHDSSGRTSASGPADTTTKLPLTHDGFYLNQHDDLSVPTVMGDEDLPIGCTSVVRRDDVDDIIQVAALFLHFARNSLRPRHMQYYTCLSPAGTPGPLSAGRLIEPSKLLSNLNAEMQLRGLPWKPLEDRVFGMCGVSGEATPTTPVQGELQDCDNGLYGSPENPDAAVEPPVEDSTDLVTKTEDRDLPDRFNDIMSSSVDKAELTALEPTEEDNLVVTKPEDGDTQDTCSDMSGTVEEPHKEGSPDADKKDEVKESHEWISIIWPDPSKPVLQLQELEDREGRSEPTPLMPSEVDSTQKLDNAAVVEGSTSLAGEAEENLHYEQTGSMCLDSDTPGLALPEMEGVKEKENKTEGDKSEGRGRKWWKQGRKEKRGDKRTNSNENEDVGGNKSVVGKKKGRRWWKQAGRGKKSDRGTDNSGYEKDATKKSSKNKWWKIWKKEGSVPRHPHDSSTTDSHTVDETKSQDADTKKTHRWWKRSAKGKKDKTNNRGKDKTEEEFDGICCICV